MEREKQTNANGTQSAWDSLADLPFRTGGGIKTEGGIILTGNAAHEQRMKAMQPEIKDSQDQENVIQFDSKREISNDGKNEENVAKQEIAFVQSTDLANKLQRDQNYFTYLVNAEHGFAVEKSQAVDTYIEKMKAAEGNEEIWQAMRMGRDIINGHDGFTDEEKQRVKDFMNSPLGRKKELSYRVASAEKYIKSLNEGVKRCEEEYNKLNSRNVIDKFLNRWKIRESKDRLAAARKRRDDTLRDMKRQQAELQGLEEELEQAA